MSGIPTQQLERAKLAEHYRRVRAESESICEPLEIEDFQLQSIIETSPPKWHIAHVSWFFEAFVLPHFNADYKVFHPKFSYLFNSYYETVGDMQPRPKRGLLSRPTLSQVFQYRQYIDEHMLQLIDTVDEKLWAELEFRVTLGLNHEQQHQELLFMDIKHNFSVNPLRPVYKETAVATHTKPVPLGWLERAGGIYDIGYSNDSFAFDNETPRHRALIEDHRLASRLVSNGEYLAFITDDGYQRPELWLADGWYLIQGNGWKQPLYWQQIDDDYWQFTLSRPRNRSDQEGTGGTLGGQYHY